MTDKHEREGHTAEPWKVFTSTDGMKLLGVGQAKTAEGITDYRGGIWNWDDKEGIANARRIVACVNACKAIGIEVLERRGLGYLAGLSALLEESHAHADAAEALLEELAKQWLPAELEEHTGDTDADYEAGYVACVEKARAFLEARKQ